MSVEKKKEKEKKMKIKLDAKNYKKLSQSADKECCFKKNTQIFILVI